MLKHTDVEALITTLKEAVKRRTTSGSALPPSPARWPTSGLDESAARRPSAKSLKSSGLSERHGRSPVDTFDAGCLRSNFVGDPAEIADNVKVYREGATLSALISPASL
jgi:hypothetical protein